MIYKKIQWLFMILLFVLSLVYCSKNNYPAANFYLLLFFIDLYMFNEDLKEK